MTAAPAREQNVLGIAGGVCVEIMLLGILLK